jgi:hypothetical protein
MGLDNIPEHCPCGAHRQNDDVPYGLTHLEAEPCPFQTDKVPVGIVGTCCSLRGKAAAYQLEALGETTLANRMYEDMTAEEALDFAQDLAIAATRLEEEHRDEHPKPKGAGWNGTWDPKTKTWGWEDYSTFEEAIATVREAARWYEKVSSLGYGVHAWY